MRPLTAEQLQGWRAFRRELHQYPEVSGEERATAQRVAERLGNMSVDAVWEGVGGTGVVALFDSGVEGPTTLLRAELDALPITEWADATERPHRSLVEGKSHACGHDGHATILCAVADALAALKPSKGEVLLLWQPAEENGQGAPAVLKDPRWAGPIPEPNAVFALHNLPGIPEGVVVTRQGPFTAAARSIVVHFNGKTSHAAEPEHGRNPAAAMAEFTLEMLRGAQPELGRPDFSVVTPIHAELGEVAYGVSAGTGVSRFTIRTWDEQQMAHWVRSAEALAHRLGEQHGLGVVIEWTEVFQANENSADAVATVEAGAASAGLIARRAEFPFKWGEDFGLFTQRYPGAMFGLGAGEQVPALHNPDYDFPDDLIEQGMCVFLGILNQRHV